MIRVLILGFLIIALNFIIFPFLQNKSKNDLTNESNKIEHYWEKTEINISDLKSYVNNKKCQDNSKYFLSCINSLLFALEKTDFHLTTSGEIQANTEIDLDSLNEKERLKPFLNIYDKGLSHNFNFDQLWEKTLGLSKSSFKKHLIAFGINGFLSINKDPHTYIGPTDYFIEVSSKNEKSKYLVGLSLKKNNQKLIIIQVIKNSDADLAGLKNNDQVLSINGKSTDTMTINDANFLLRDSNQEIFKLEVIRKNQVISKEIKRSYRVLSQVYGEILDNEKRIGYIQLSKFNVNVCDNVKQEIEKMNPRTLKGLIFDLRNNPGGFLYEVSCLGGLFIGKDKKIFSVVYQNVLEEEAETISDRLYSGPMVILTNNNSASASELLAGAMQEYNRAIIIGEKTFGKGSFQEITRWKGSSKISLYKTQGFYLLPSGESTQLQGVTPDLIVDSEPEGNRESNTYKFPLKYQANKISKTKKLQYNKKFNYSKKCLRYSEKILSSEDPTLNAGKNFLNCQIAESGL